MLQSASPPCPPDRMKLRHILLIVIGAIALWCAVITLFGILTTVVFDALDDGSYIPGRDTTAWWADGEIEILRVHNRETEENEYHLFIRHRSVENGLVSAYKRRGNPVQVLIENRLYSIDENTLAYTVQTLSDEEIPALTRGFRRLKP